MAFEPKSCKDCTQNDPKADAAAVYMLIKFRFSNVRSFRDEQEFSMVAAPFHDNEKAVLRPPSLREGLLGSAGIYGANASGKTNALRALAFMSSAVNESYRSWPPNGGVPREAFRLDPDSDQKPSLFEVDFLLKGVRHQYGFIADSTRIQQEWLFVYPTNRKQTWFRRDPGEMRFSEKMPGEKRTIESLTRPNSLFLSTAAQTNHPQLTSVYQWFAGGIHFVDSDRQRLLPKAARLLVDTELSRRVNEMMSSADLGIVGARLLEEKVPESLRNALLTVISAMNTAPSLESGTADSSVNRQTVEFLHKVRGNQMTFQAEDESQGTVAFFALLGPILQALRDGSVVLVDELDAHLHPLLALQIMKLFNDNRGNRNGGQLIFTTHDTNLFQGLRRDQIWFTEKDRDGCSVLYPLTDFRPRRNENLENGYLQGRYGAIPFLNPEVFASSIKDEQ